jgi:Tol biopolymer transport system component
VSSSGRVANNPLRNLSVPPSISADGRYVAFGSPATNLVPGDTNGQDDIFVRGPLHG